MNGKSTYATMLLLCLLLVIPVAGFSQAGNGTISGTVSDSSSAVIPGVTLQVKNTDTGVVFETVSTETGTYFAPNLPPGPYSITASLPGFKTLNRTGLTLSAAQTLRVDVPLEVGTAGDNITISAEATLLKTETGDIAHNITLEQLTDLPILGIGNANAGSSGVRNPFNSTQLVPGVNYTANSSMIINGAPTNTASYRLEGMDNTNHTVSFALQENQPSADAVQEVAVQTSNYAPEFGTAGGGLFNITMKSGTSQYHGSFYEYFVNEDLNAGYAYTENLATGGGKVRPRNRRNDFGGTAGGPIPFLTKGSRRTFFFFSIERFLETTTLPFSLTVPTVAFRNGDFSAISPNGGAGFNPALGIPTAKIGTDAQGQPIFANEIYDPTTRGVLANGSGFALPFANNKIDPGRITPFAKAVMALIPLPTNSNLTNNATGSNLSNRVTGIPSIKIDHSINDKNKISFYWSTTGTASQYSTPNGNADGLPEEITGARGTFIDSQTWRFNYDRVLTTNLLAHVGAGYSHITFIDQSPYTRNGHTFDCATISLAGCFIAFNFPTITGASSTTLGGIQQLGNSQAHTTTNTERPSFNANATWIHGKHNYKVGSEVWFQGNITAPPSGVSLTFGTNATAEPYTVPAGLGGQNMGFGFASFLLAGPNTTAQNTNTDVRMGKAQWALFAQDSWKATRKLTLDYGLRWDYATVPREEYGRSAILSLTTPNPAVGGHLGAAIFQQTCHCDFLQGYKDAFGPRIGFAYQLDPHTVIRGGWGFVYSAASDIAATLSSSSTLTPTGTNAFVDATAASGALPQPLFPNFDPGQTPLPGSTTGLSGLNVLDRNAARPARQSTYSIGVQREITRDLLVDASFVGNRGVWWPGGLSDFNRVSPAAYAALGLDPYNNPADNLLITQPISSAAVTSRIGVLPLPYAGYSTANTLANTLKPFPQFSNLTGGAGSATGKIWYDSMQVKVTKRMSSGLQVNGSYTWSKNLTLNRQDFFHPALSSKTLTGNDQPQILSMNILYQTQKYFGNRYATILTKDWQIGSFLQYASGTPLAPPSSATTNNLFGNEQSRVAGQPLFLKDLNCHCMNPTQEQVLNPLAWTSPAAGTAGVSSGLFYTDFRAQRRPSESLNIGRNFRMGRENRPITLSVRAEFANIFNRTYLANPGTSNPQLPATKNGASQLTGGFGVIPEIFAPTATPSASSQLPRTGTIVARIQF
jgi:Carboxypeptidase regulatory-like domain/TonB dependent receptor